MENPFKLLSTRYSNRGINTISHVEIFKANIIIKNNDKKIYHLRFDYNEEASAWETLEYFKTKVLPEIDCLFVLIITGEDITIPNQLDIRWKDPQHLSLIKNTYIDIVNHPLLLHCYIENRDEPHIKTSSIPLGINPREMPDYNVDYLLRYMDYIPPLKTRNIKVICIQRDRPGDREKINKLKISHWSNNVIIDGDYNHDSWYKLLQTYPFIICAHGGGIDPCPKIWEALCLGCIPIIKHSALDDIYQQFPIVFVNNWEPDTINVENLNAWLEKYSKYYDDNELRKQWVSKLFLHYWKEKINSHF